MKVNDGAPEGYLIGDWCFIKSNIIAQLIEVRYHIDDMAVDPRLYHNGTFGVFENKKIRFGTEWCYAIKLTDEELDLFRILSNEL